MDTKQNIRQYIRDISKVKTFQELEELSNDVCQNIISRTKQERNTHMTLLLYWSLPDEVQTINLIETLHQTGHHILLPVVTGNTLQLREYTDAHDMVTGAFDIPEPIGGEFTDYDKIDLAFIPGRAFTTDGARLGRGKGYYDRLLTKIGCPLIGVCFPFQIVEKIPMDTHDIMMNEVIY